MPSAFSGWLQRLLLGSSLASLLAIAPAFAQDMEVDLELVLAVDVSRSMDFEEQEVQRQGYIAGLTHPEILAAIDSGFLGRIAVTYVEWAGPGSHAVIVTWTLIDGPESAQAFVARLDGTEVSRLRGTSISSAINFTAGMFEGNGYRATRQVIDVSGDGPNNMGSPVLDARAAALDKGITINGLPIMLHTRYDGMFSIGDLDVYYENCVIGGPGAFLVTVETIDRLAEAIRRKLVLEIAGQPARIVPVQLFPQARPDYDCLIGERLRRRWMVE
jgi:hypothetical protein